MFPHHLVSAGFAALCATPNVVFTAQHVQGPDPVITVHGQSFHSWGAYVGSPLFRDLGLRCGAPAGSPPGAPGPSSRLPGDCSSTATTILPLYEPTTLLEIPVVVHVLMDTRGNGQVPDTLIHSQLDVLNEDFQALPTSPGANGTDVRVRFRLATQDPAGAPTSGITRTVDDEWFQDRGDYWNTLAWDPTRYLNVYTNTASGFLGYVPRLPQNGLVGADDDRIVLLWSAMGRNAPIGPPFDQGRTLTHEVGHWLGLYHTFQGGSAGCGGGDCYTTGDLVCDTAPESSARFGCPLGATSCGTLDPVWNYMDYTDDACMTGFTPEQANRMRCTLQNWRPDVAPDCTAAVAKRTAGANLDRLSMGAPILGTSVPVVVDGSAAGFSWTMLFMFAGADHVALTNGSVALVDFTSKQYFRESRPGALGTYTLALPADPTLCGLHVYAQAALYRTLPDYVLTNSQDLRLGY